MKNLYLTLIVAASMISHAQARIGFSLEQCRTAYGKQVKTEESGTLSPQKACGFISNNLYVYALFSKEGKVVDITYFDNKVKSVLSPTLKASLWALNVDQHRVWDDTFYRTICLTTGWNGKREYKRLGNENFKHNVMYEANGPSALVENASKLGWQIRTMQQFMLEQAALKESAVR